MTSPISDAGVAFELSSADGSLLRNGFLTKHPHALIATVPVGSPTHGKMAHWFMDVGLGIQNLQMFQV